MYTNYMITSQKLNKINSKNEKLGKIFQEQQHQVHFDPYQVQLHAKRNSQNKWKNECGSNEHMAWVLFVVFIT